MARKDLLSEAIADAKAVKETALANAKLALEEAFTPKLQSMISAKLAEELDDEELEEDEMGLEDELEEDEEEVLEMDDELEEDEEEEVLEMDDEIDEDEDDLDLESIIRELEMDDEEVVEHDEEEDIDEDEEEVDLAEVIRVLQEMGDDEIDEDEVEPETADIEAELEEAYDTIKSLQSTINEVNLLNAKLLYTNKLFRTFDLNESQKVKVLENFDRTSSVREVKLVFSTIAENLNVARKKRTIVKEGYASKPTKSSAPKRKIISEGNQMAARWKKLAGLK